MLRIFVSVAITATWASTNAADEQSQDAQHSKNLVTNSSLLVVVGPGRPDTVPKPDLKPLLAEVRKLVEKHYPKAKSSLEKKRIHFEYNTRKFMLHELSRNGKKWQDAHEEWGPQPGGIYCDIELRQGKYSGPAAKLPWVMDERYFTLYWAVPYSKKLNRHLFIHLKYPKGVSKEFLNAFKRLTDDFERHVPDKAK